MFADKISVFVFEYLSKIHFNDLANAMTDNFSQNFIHEAITVLFLSACKFADDLILLL